MDVQAWYLRTSKLALALAIIRSKPADKTSKEYAEHLAMLVSEKESTWKSKIEVLEAEVLELRQKLLLSKICLRSCNGENLSSQLQAQEPNSENTLTPMEDSGCDLSNEQRTEPSELSQNFVESCNPTAFLPLPLVKRPYITSGNPLSSHMQFFQHLLELKNLTESGSLKTDLTPFQKDSSIVCDSVLQLLNGLIAFYRNPKLPLSSFWAEAVGILAKLITDSNLSKQILKKCSEKLEEFEKTLIQAILGNNNLNRFQMQHCISQNLVTLGRCSILRKSIISLLLSEVNHFADDLVAINQAQSSYDATHYENIFSLFWVLEQLLQKKIEEANTSSTGHNEEEIKKFLNKQDEIIFQLSDTFPLFTCYLWRIGILLNSAEAEVIENN
ncbi:meiosis-specific protein MEI4 [Ochotona curzoniae]|uniref:meiosis-specific protein MEI4 n=1 Tax=Ochotona curzoniae TaxID=130825 RepID=UPI001B35129E|nr:meiosis-specific protein MEI4 [Ochotona curzoniae]